MLIAGAGIGGLTLALQLHEAGIGCRILEAAPQLAALGVGINILPHASRELHRLGLGPALDLVAVRTTEARFYNRFGQFIYAEPLGSAAGYPWPQYSVHRGDLQAVLLDAVRERPGPDVLGLDSRVISRAGDVLLAVQQQRHRLFAEHADRLHRGVRRHGRRRPGFRAAVSIASSPVVR